MRQDGKITITASVERVALARAFVISRGARTVAEVVTVRANRAGHDGRGEGVPYARYGETVQSVLAQLAALPPVGGFDGPGWPDLAGLLRLGTAHNALDGALNDLVAKAAG